MRVHLGLIALLAAVAPHAAGAAGLSRTYLVPAYAPCPGPAICPARLESSFSFTTALLRSPQVKFIAPNKLTLIIELTGVKDATGALVTTDPNDPSDDFRLVLPGNQVTITSLGTLPPGFPGAGEQSVRIDLRKGAGKARLVTPEDTPKTGLVTGSTGVPTIYDNQGKRLAVTGAQTPP
jgi:hypothetical protein